MAWIKSLVRGNCPHCRQAPIFKSVLSMNENCPHCGIHFERESGYFSMSIFVAYMMAIFIAAPSLYIVYLLGLDTYWYYLSPVIIVVLLFPLLFRYGRIVWLYLDEWMDPRPPEAPST